MGNTLEQLEDKQAEETLKIEQKFYHLKRPLYKVRSDTIRKIPNFWCQVVRLATP